MRMLTAAGLVAIAFATVPVAAHQQSEQSSAPATAAVAGRVTDAATGRPLEGVVLRLLSWEVMRVPKSAATDADGRFEFAELVPGRYELTATAGKYVTQEFGQRSRGEPGRPIDLVGGQRFVDADFELVRTSAIEGVVVDEFGDPAPNILVQASEPRFIAGRRRLMPANTPRDLVTDDRGHFRIAGLPPGDYYLTALSGIFRGPDETGGFAPTFYPGTLKVSDASPVRVPPGQDVAGLSLALLAAATVPVSGLLVDENGRPLPGGNVVFMAHDTTGASGVVFTRGVADDEGRFAFRNVPSGAYTIQAFGRPVGGGNLGRAPFGWLSVTVGDRELSELRVRVLPGAVARGRIVFAGDPASLAPRQVDVSARPIDFESAPIAGGPPNSVTRDDWTFEVQNMSGARAMRVDVAAPGWAVERITWRGRDITDMALDFSQGDVNDIEVTLTDRITTLDVTVSAAEGDRVEDGSVSVVVFASDSSKWLFPSRFISLARPNQTGRFRVTGLPPELYLVVALPAVHGGEWQNPEYLETLRALATPVRLIAGGTETVDIRMARR